MTSKSLWMDIDVAPDAEVLDGVHECEVAVIGSGIAGISTAYELCKRGKSVIVVDRGRICGGMTSRTSAHLAPLCDDLVSEMTKIKGKEATKLFCDSQAAAVDRIEEIQNKENIDCDFRRLDGYLFQGRDMPADIIDEEMDAVRDVGAPVHRLVGVPLQGCEDRNALRYPRQATFHPLKYLAGVAKACSESGVTFFREWDRRSQRVMVMADGFAWNGQTYDSLSKVAFAITGTKWNGPRFFGLRDKEDRVDVGAWS